jgi:hypothetical protein
VLDPQQGALDVWSNEGGDIVGGNGWRPLGRVALGTNNPIDHVDFADVNGDRRDDYLVLADDGSVHAWLNRGGDLPGGNGWQDIGVIATGVGQPRQRVRLANLNCDDAVDYLVVGDSDGAVNAWSNSGSDAPVFQQISKVAAGGGPGARVQFADINGDGRDDYLVIADNGALQGWLNADGDRSLGGGGQPYL